MLTKAFTAVVLAGALWVAGDAAYQRLDCCRPGANCCSPARECCELTSSSSSNCCSTASRASLLAGKHDCCSSATTAPCCNATINYCTRIDQIVSGCCCEFVDGQYRCLITGEVSSECCCIPLE